MVIKFEFHYPEEYRTSSFYDYYGFFRKLDYGYLMPAHKLIKYENN